MNLDTLKKKLLSLRNSLSRQRFGTELRSLKNGIFLTIKTTVETGPISRKEVTAQIEVNSAFLKLSKLDQERMLIKELENKMSDKCPINVR